MGRVVCGRVYGVGLCVGGCMGRGCVLEGVWGGVSHSLGVWGGLCVGGCNSSIS